MNAGLYRDITPITLHVDEDSLTASLYCSTVHGLEGAEVEALVESFLVEVFRCRVCLFTTGHKSRIVAHLLQRHHVAGGDGAMPSCPGEEPDRGLQVSPYSLEDQDLEDQDLEDQDLEDQDLDDQDLEDQDLEDRDLEDQDLEDQDLEDQDLEDQDLEDLEDQDLSGGSKPPSDEDSLGLDRISFLLPMYGMLPNISPRSCDIGLGSQSDGGLHVAQTCEVSTLFEDEVGGDGDDSHMFTLKETRPSNHDDETAQSAHLMTLGLCRISAPLKATPPAPKSPTNNPEPRPHEETPRRDTLRRRSTAPAQQSAASRRTDRRTGTGRYLKKRRKEKERGRERKKRHIVTVQSRDRLHKHVLSKHKTSADKQKVVPPCVVEGRHSAGKRIPGGAVLQEDSRGATKSWGRRRNTHAVKNRGGRDGDEDKTIKTTAEENGGRREFCCSLCNRKFISKLTLRRHMGIHQGEKPYECPHCDYNTRLKASLVQHIRIHTGEKPFRCSECSYASIDRSSLRRHSRTHSQEKPYRCKHCTYSSIQKKSLDLHARRHHTGESFPCQQCAYSSPDRQLLLRHVRKNHTSQHAIGHGGQRSSQPSDRDPN